MKSQLPLFFLLLGLLSSCDGNEKPSAFPIQYSLVGYQYLFSPNQEFVSVKDSLYFYNLNEDGTFLKQIGKEISRGTYDSRVDGENEFIELTFDDPQNNLIHSCYAGKEFFIMKEEKRIVGTWGDCDGPLLYFQGSSIIRLGLKF